MYEISKIKLVPQLSGLTEYWKDIEKFPNYRVSNLGNVWSKKNNIILDSLQKLLVLFVNT